MFNALCIIVLIVLFILYKKYSRFKELLDTNSALINFSVSIVTLFLVFATWNLATSTKEMAVSSKEQMNLLKEQSASLNKQLIQLEENVKTQKDSLDFEIRPYISIRLVNFDVSTGEKDTFIGGDILYHNYGKTPASKMKTYFYITTQEDGIGNRSLEEYAQDAWGGYKRVSFLCPIEFDAVSRRISLSPSATIYYINAIVTYEGIEKNKTYWTFFKKVIRILDINTSKPTYIEIDSDGNWDRNKDFTPPGLEKPNFDLYQTKK